MSELKIFDAAEEVMRMDDLQLAWSRKNGWKYLHKSLDELRAALEKAIDLAEEGIGYTPSYFRKKWSMDEELAELKKYLAAAWSEKHKETP